MKNTFKNIEERHNTIIKLFIDSIGEQIKEDSQKIKLMKKKNLYDIIEFNNSYYNISEILTSTKQKHKIIANVLYDELNDLGKTLYDEYKKYLKKWDKLNKEYMKELDETTKKIKEENSKYFMLTQLVRDD